MVRYAAAAVVALGSLAGGSSVVSGSGIESDARWLPWLGCWEAADAFAEELLCVRPMADDDGVEMITVRDGRIVSTEIVRADSEQRASDLEGCNGWKSAAFSGDNQRIYLRSEFACEGDVRRSATGLISMTSPTEWLDVQVVSVGGQDAVRVLRYRLASPEAAQAAGIEPIAAERGMAVATARTAASAAPTVDDVIEASRAVNARAVEAWVVETGEGFELDADQLVHMAESGVNESVIDLVVAISYPGTFNVDRGALAGDFRPDERTAESADRYAYPGYVDLFYWDPLRYSRYGYYSPYGYGGGYGWYPGYRPVVVIVQPGDGGEVAPPGRAVRGRGYTRGDRQVGSADGGRYTPPRSTTTQTGTVGSTKSTSTGAAKSGSTTRRAKARTGGSGGGN